MEELERFVGVEFSEHLCSELVDCVSDGAIVGYAEAEFLGIIVLGIIRYCLGAFVGVVVVVVSVGPVIMVVTGVVIIRWWGWVVVVVGWRRGWSSLGGG